MLLSQHVSFCVIEWLIALIIFIEIYIFLEHKLLLFLKINLAIILSSIVVISFTTIPYYHINTFTEQSNYVIKEASKEELKSLCIDLINKTNNCYTINSKNFNTNAKIANDSFNKLNIKYPFIKKISSIPKPVYHSIVLSNWNVTGFFSAFTLESIINKDITDVEIPFTMCHELSHIANFLREDEANFIGYLACKDSNDKFFRYSGYYCAMIYATNAYYTVDPVGYIEMMDLLSDNVKNDIYLQSTYWSRYENTKSSKTYEKIDDAFLKSNEIFDGTKSYGRMVDLLLSEYRVEKGDNSNGY